MEISNLEKVFEEELKDIYSAESQILKALPKMAKKAKSEALKSAFQEHLKQTEEQVKRLDQIGKILGIKLTGKKCKAMEGLVEEGKEMLEVEGPDGVIDTCLIAAAQRVEHYEISAYGTARAIAEHLGHEDIVELLQQTLDEESETDEKLSTLSEDEILPMALEGEGGMEDSDEEESEDDSEEDDDSDMEDEEEEKPAAHKTANKSR